MLDSKIPWSYTFGNHDVEEGEGYEILYPAITALPGCMLYNADSSIDGVGNHYLEVKNSKAEMQWLLFGIDTGMYNKLPIILKKARSPGIGRLFGIMSRRMRTFPLLSLCIWA